MGPTLFLAPSPIAWQARHLLKEVLPAAASCASAPDVAAREVRITTALKVFMGCSFFPGYRCHGFWHGRLRLDKPLNLDRFRGGELVPERTRRLRRTIRPLWPIKTGADVLDLS